MSEGIIIALITAFGSLLGGIIGQLITASATIKAATIKEKINPTPSNKDKKPHSWGIVIGGAIIGAIATLVILSLFGMFPPRTKATPTPIVTNETPTNTGELTPTPNGRIFFDEFTEGTIKWVNNIETGKIEGGEFYPENGFMLAGSNTLQNYSVRARVRLISGEIDFGIVSRFVDYYHYYTCQFWHDQSRLVIMGDNLPGGADLLATNPNGLTLGKSYDIRMDVQDKDITCFLDGNVIATASDNTYTAGKFGLRVFNTQVAFDKVEVFEIP